MSFLTYKIIDFILKRGSFLFRTDGNEFQVKFRKLISKLPRFDRLLNVTDRHQPFSWEKNVFSIFWKKRTSSDCHNSCNYFLVKIDSRFAVNDAWHQSIVTNITAVVLVNLPACSPSTLKIQVRIPLMPTAFFVKIMFEKAKN